MVRSCLKKQRNETNNPLKLAVVLPWPSVVDDICGLFSFQENFFIHGAHYRYYREFYRIKLENTSCFKVLQWWLVGDQTHRFLYYTMKFYGEVDVRLCFLGKEENNVTCLTAKEICSHGQSWTSKDTNFHVTLDAF